MSGWMFQVDYFERAKHVEEIPLLQKYYEEERLHMKEVWEQQEQERVSSTSIDTMNNNIINNCYIWLLS